MSSIKQVQDLQSQLAELRQENTHLRTRATDRSSMEIDRVPSGHRRAESFSNLQGKPHRVQPPVMHNFDLVRRNIRIYSEDIFDHASQDRWSSVTTNSGLSLPDMPSRTEFAYLSRFYLDTIHLLYPVIHWPSFQHEVDQVYTARSFDGMPREWVGLFFAVLGCGTLQVPVSPPGSPRHYGDGMAFYDTAARALTPTPRELSLTHVRVAFLLSVFSAESNKKSEGGVWLATAVRLAQQLGLHLEREPQDVLDGEMRRRLWWSIYSRDRFWSFGANLPMLIHEDDCEVGLPSSIGDRYIQPQGFARPRTTLPPYSGFVAIIQVARLYWELSRTLRASVIPAQTLQSYDERFHAVMMLFPDSYHSHAGSDSPLEPAALAPIFALQSARFHLYRHNLSPVCRQSERSEALRRSLSVAQDTTKYISRSLRPSLEKTESERSWQTRVTQLASDLICTHLWRCLLTLCFRGEYEAALVCLHMTSTIGDVRRINTACGKNLAFFLDRLLERIRSGNGAQHQLEHDEEMLAYVSGDMQGNLEHAWVWSGPASPVQTSPHTSPTNRVQPLGSDEPVQGAILPLRPNAGSPQNGIREWDGWGRIEQQIRHLIEEHRVRLAQPPSYYPPPHNPMKRVQLAPSAPVSPSTIGPIPPSTPSSTSRISIANII